MRGRIKKSQSPSRMTSARRKKRKQSARRTGKTNNVSYLNQQLREKYADDMRGPNSISAPVESMAVNPAMPISVEVNASVFPSILLPVMSYAISRGFSLNTLDDNFIYWAWIYQANLLLNAAQGGVPQTATGPRWLALLYQAVVQTSVKFRGGQAAYQMTITNDPDVGFEQRLGPPSFGHIYSLGIKTSALINGLFPVIGPPTAYTEVNGQRATQQLWQFLAADSMKGSHKYHEMHEKVSIGEANIMTGDVSAFAWFDFAPGGGKNDTGAWYKQLYHEVDIRRPMFSVFSPNDKIRFNRAQVQLRAGSGDCLTLGGLLVDGVSQDQLGMKTYPVPKFLDFTEYLDVLANVVCKVIQLRTQTAAFIENIKNDSTYYISDIQCPLTLQELGLILRATLMLVYTDTKAYQGIYPRTATSASDNEFVVYNCGIQTAPIPLGSQMLLPMYMIENILANRSRSVENGRAGHRNPVMHIAVLGQYNRDRLDPKDFTDTYVVDDITATVPCFADSTGETELNFIDGGFTTGSGGYAAINDPVGIVKLVNVWNKWVMSMGDHFRKVGSIDTDSGISALATIGLTSHFITQNEKLAWKEKCPPCKEKSKAEGESKKPVSKFTLGHSSNSTFSSVYSDRSLIAYSAGYEIFQQLWESYLQYFVTAINKIDPASTEGENTGYLRVAAFEREPRQVDVATGSVQFSTLAERHQIMATMCVKTKFAQDTVQEDVLSTIEDSGHAGILGELSGALIGAVGRAGVDVAAKLLENSIPF